jgi:arylmalonate decarboxylase
LSSRRWFLQAGLALGASPSRAAAADAPVLGLIFPPADRPTPADAARLYPHVRFLSDGVGVARMTPEGFDEKLDRMVPAAERLRGRGAQAIALMGTSMSFYRGVAFNQGLTDSITKATGLPATTMSTAMVQALHAVGARRVTAATAYGDEINRRLRVFLEQAGFEVLTVKGLGIESISNLSSVTQADLFAFCSGVYQSAPAADALFVSCGGLDTLDLIAPLERRCGAPTISSLPHALWGAVRLLGLSGRSPGFGRLFAQG